jgi:hypothetical protein
MYDDPAVMEPSSSCEDPRPLRGAGREEREALLPVPCAGLKEEDQLSEDRTLGLAVVEDLDPLVASERADEIQTRL